MEELKLNCIGVTLAEIENEKDLSQLKNWATVVQCHIVEIKNNMTFTWTEAQQNGQEPDEGWQFRVRKAKAVHSHYLSTIQKRIAQVKLLPKVVGSSRGSNMIEASDESKKTSKKRQDAVVVTDLSITYGPKKSRSDFFDILGPELKLTIQCDEIGIFSETVQDSLIDLFRIYSLSNGDKNIQRFTFQDFFLENLDFSFLLCRNKQNYFRNDWFGPRCLLPETTDTTNPNPLTEALIEFMELKQCLFRFRSVEWQSKNNVHLELNGIFPIDMYPKSN